MLPKPAHVFNREREWATLSRFANSPSDKVSLGIVSGRRRQGKTYLLDALATQVDGFFYAATESTERDSLTQFGVALAAATGGGRYAFDTWEEALERLFVALPDRLVIIDEFPYLVKASPALPSVLQKALGPRGLIHESGSRLLLCGSAMSVMGSLLAGNAPLRGRSSLELVLHPLGYRDAASFWGITDPRLAVQVNAIVGGTPAYRREFVADDAPDDLADFDSWVIRAVLNPYVPLFREARYLLAEETQARDPAGYHATLGAMAAGHRTRGAIANHIGRKSTDLAHPLSVLEDARLVERQIDPFRKGRSFYRICEPLITFYEAIMRRHWTRLERGDAVGAWRNAQQTFTSQIVGPHFEELCREWTLQADMIGEGPIGDVAATTVNDPDRQTQIEVDVVALAPTGPNEPQRVIALGESKWGTPLTLAHIERLRRVAGLLETKGVHTADARLIGFSGVGFDQDLTAAARQDPRIVLVGLRDLYAPTPG